MDQIPATSKELAIEDVSPALATLSYCSGPELPLPIQRDFPPSRLVATASKVSVVGTHLMMSPCF